MNQPWEMQKVFLKVLFSHSYNAHSHSCRDQMMDDPNLQMGRGKFASLLRIPWLRAITEKTIKSAFRNAGIIPFNPAIILDNHSNFLTSANFAAGSQRTQNQQTADKPVHAEATESCEELGVGEGLMSDDEDVGAAGMLLHIGRGRSEPDTGRGGSEPQSYTEEKAPTSEPFLVAQDPSHPDSPQTTEDNIHPEDNIQEAPDFQQTERVWSQERGETNPSMQQRQTDIHQTTTHHSQDPSSLTSQQRAGAPTIEGLEAQMELHPVQALVLTLP
jgi:hypothetical protein